jgi:5-methylcytosine-specific restriction endonuclease McrA
MNKQKCEFSKNRARYDGLSNYCKPCAYSHTRKWISTEEGRKKFNSSHLKYRQTSHGQLTRKRADKKRNKTQKRKLWIKNRELDVGRQLWKRKYFSSEKFLTLARHKERRRRELKKAVDSIFTIQDAAFVKNKFQNICFNCGSSERLSIDHHYPLSKGFGLSIKNAVLLCKSCNSSKNNRFPEEFYTEEKLNKLKEFLK